MRPGAGIPSSAGLPPVATSGDGNRWLTSRCCFRCGDPHQSVTYVGTIHVPGQNAAAFACGPCLTAMAAWVWMNPAP